MGSLASVATLLSLLSVRKPSFTAWVRSMKSYCDQILPWEADLAPGTDRVWQLEVPSHAFLAVTCAPPCYGW